MKKLCKRLSLVFVMIFAIAMVSFTNVLAADDGIIGSANLNGTAENSANIGDILTLPEKDWKRYDDGNSNISYTGKFINIGNIDTYQGATHQCVSNTEPEYVRFNFKGNKIRLLSVFCYAYPDDGYIKIDNIEYKFNIKSNVNSYKVLAFEKSDLEDREHSVEIYQKDSSYLGLCIDAIDINKDGYMKPYDKTILTNVSNITLNKSTDNLQVGQSEALVATIMPDNATNKTVIWVSSDPTIAIVDSKGKVTGVKEGVAKITAATVDGTNLNASCTINVVKETSETNSNYAILTITMDNGNIKSYVISMTKVNDFLGWYNTRASDSNGNAYYAFDKTESSQPFIKRTEYLLFDKISSFEVDEYIK